MNVTRSVSTVSKPPSDTAVFFLSSLSQTVQGALITDVINEIETIAGSGADAVIIQDLAVAELWKKYCPSMPLHASTQMTIHNLSGAKKAEELGFSRIVLARELSFEEIKTITVG